MLREISQTQKDKHHTFFSCMQKEKKTEQTTTLDLEAEDNQWGDYQGVRRRRGEKGDGEGGDNQSTDRDAMKKPYICTDNTF